MPRKKSTRKKTKKRTNKPQHHDHVLYGGLAVLGAIAIGAVLFGMMVH